MQDPSNSRCFCGYTRLRLKSAVFYEVYPQSFADSNADGIGDLPGLISKLDYIKGLGCDAIWLNPCFVSPFQDAGYDVADFYEDRARYGTQRGCGPALRRSQEARHAHLPGPGGGALLH